MIKYNPSLIAAACVYVTYKIIKKQELNRVVEITQYPEERLRDIAKDICLVLDSVEKSTLQAVRKKFSLPKYMEVAKIKFH